MLKSEEQIRNLYRAYIELWATSDEKNKSNILYGAILAYGRILEFNANKIERDMQMAKNKYPISH